MSKFYSPILVIMALMFTVRDAMALCSLADGPDAPYYEALTPVERVAMDFRSALVGTGRNVLGFKHITKGLKLRSFIATELRSVPVE